MLNSKRKPYKKIVRYVFLISLIIFVAVTVFFRNMGMFEQQMPIKKIDSLFGAIRIAFMDKEYGIEYGFLYPNMISLIAFLLILISLLCVLEDNKNFSWSEYDYLKYRLSKKGFLRYLTFDLLRNCLFSLSTIVLFLALVYLFDKLGLETFYLILIYLVRLFLLLFGIVFLRRTFQIIYKREQMVIVQYLILILMAIIDNYSNLNLISMSSNFVYEFTYILVLLLLIVVSYCFISCLVIKCRREFL